MGVDGIDKADIFDEYFEDDTFELKYAPRKCKYFCCGDCGISGRTCISDYPECRAAELKE